MQSFEGGVTLHKNIKFDIIKGKTGSPAIFGVSPQEWTLEIYSKL